MSFWILGTCSYFSEIHSFILLPTLNPHYRAQFSLFGLKDLSSGFGGHSYTAAEEYLSHIHRCKAKARWVYSLYPNQLTNMRQTSQFVTSTLSVLQISDNMGFKPANYLWGFDTLRSIKVKNPYCQKFQNWQYEPDLMIWNSIYPYQLSK